jgi:hypothetical protein
LVHPLAHTSSLAAYAVNGKISPFVNAKGTTMRRAAHAPALSGAFVPEGPSFRFDKTTIPQNNLAPTERAATRGSQELKAEAFKGLNS